LDKPVGGVESRFIEKISFSSRLALKARAGGQLLKASPFRCHGGNGNRKLVLKAVFYRYRSRARPSASVADVSMRRMVAFVYIIKAPAASSC